MGKIEISPRHSDIKTLSMDILKRNGLSVKFKVKLFNNGFNNLPTYYHQEYIYNLNKMANVNINLNLQPFIQITIKGEDEKDALLMTEVNRNKFIRKISNFVGLLEAYDAEDIDLITVDSSGTHIMTCFSKDSNVTVKLGKSELHLELVIREESCDIGVFISSNNECAIISVYDFLDLVYKMRSINYLQTALSLVTYFGSPEIGENATDFRDDVPLRNDNDFNPTGGGSSVKDDFDGLKKNNSPNSNSKKLMW